MVVVIDPGHGGKDPGASTNGVREKDVVLGIGLKLGKYLNENFQDVKVIYTRNTDVFIPLIERSRIANKNKADLFISIHANACSTPATRGTETFVLGLHRSLDNLDVAKKENSVILLEDNYSTTYEGFDPNSPESYIMFEMAQDIYMDQSLSFADDIQNQFKYRIKSSNRGVKQAGFLVLRQSSMPSVLIEAGFISNRSEANFLNSEAGQKEIALSIFDAFRKFKARNSGLTNPVTAEVKSVPVKKQPVADTTAANKPEESKKNEEVKKTETTLVAASLNNSPDQSSTFYSIQIGANTTPLDPVASNFKGLKNVRREKTDKYYRYFVGKTSSIEEINPILNQVKLKFPQAFLVFFVDGKRNIVNLNSK